jgi:amphiphysin
MAHESKSLASISSTHVSTNPVEWLRKKTGTAIKKVSRIEEKFNQAIGKASRTEDEIFETNVMQFEEQYQLAQQFSKEFNKYLACLKETQKCSKNFNEIIKQIYESSWSGYTEVIAQCQAQEQYWSDYITLLMNHLYSPMNNYLKEFPDLRKQIDKRDNKLLDYDKARHNLEDLRIAKKPDEIRIEKASNDLETKKFLYEDINKELHYKLPLLHETRKTFYSKTFQSIFNIESTFHTNMTKSKSKLNNLCDNLYDKYKNDLANFSVPSYSSYSIEQANNYEDQNHNSQSQSEFLPKISKFSDDDDDDDDDDNGNDVNEEQEQEIANGEDKLNSKNSLKNGKITLKNSNSEPLYSNILVDNHHPATISDESSESTRFTKSKVLYRVKATYPYDAKEVDELTFLKEDLIEVIEGTESEKEDLDDGWLIGIHINTQKRGLFPQNFTKKLS